jgi:hypothetical protein
MFTLDRKLWLTADKERVVEDGHPDAAFLLGSAGTVIAEAEAERLGLKTAPKTALKAAEAPQEEPAEEKQAAAPANKARKKTANKSK